LIDIFSPHPPRKIFAIRLDGDLLVFITLYIATGGREQCVAVYSERTQHVKSTESDLNQAIAIKLNKRCQIRQLACCAFFFAIALLNEKRAKQQHPNCFRAHYAIATP
jgi:hypothetical protein